MTAAAGPAAPPAGDPVLRRRPAVLAAAVGLAAASGTAVLVAPSDAAAPVGWTAAVTVAAGLSPVLAAVLLPRGAVVPRVRALLVALGLTWSAGALVYVDLPALRVPGALLSGLWLAVLVHLLLTFPSGRTGDRWTRAAVVTAYLVLLAAAAGALPGAGAVVGAAVGAAQLVFGAALTAVIARRVRRAPATQRRALGPVLVSGAVVVVGLLVAQGVRVLTAGLTPAWPPAVTAWDLVSGLALMVLPLGFAVAVGRAQQDRAAVADLARRLDRALSPADLRAELAAALHDPDLEIAYWLPDERRHVDGAGAGVALPPPGGSRTATVLAHGEARIGALLHSADCPAPLVDAVAATARLALENVRLRADLAVQLTRVRASRARLVETADAERRRLERNLHDGAQQRLVNATMAVALARRHVRDDEPARRAVEAVAVELRGALADLREVARGVHPAILSAAGLGPALQALAERSPVPVRVEVTAPARLPERVEEAAYFAVSEALANVSKHARATVVAVAVTAAGGHLRVEVTDDGVGGARADAGTGLRGLADRALAVGGRLDVRSPTGGGTTLTLELPCAS